MGLETKPFSTVIIIGAGFSGLNMSCQLERVFSFHDYCIYDRLNGIGGTWLANTCL
jgi:cation diffusion facilitator CzcD-associated flavoprotein CzcO